MNGDLATSLGHIQKAISELSVETLTRTPADSEGARHLYWGYEDRDGFWCEVLMTVEEYPPGSGRLMLRALDHRGWQGSSDQDRAEGFPLWEAHYSEPS